MMDNKPHISFAVSLLPPDLGKAFGVSYVLLGLVFLINDLSNLQTVIDI